VVSGCGQFAAIAVACQRIDSIFKDLESETFVEFHARGAQQRANGLGRAALASDYLAQVFGVNAQLKDCHLRALNRPDLYSLRVIYQRSSYFLY
jgi:hypothetical protein